MLGRRIGNYQITERLAEGGMGAVYVAEHPAIGRRVAVKVLLPEVASDQEMVRRFFNEARAAHAIRHPGIVEILDFGTLDDGASYIVMELLEGENLAARLRRVGRLPLETAIDFTRQAASALGAAHAQAIVHRDLKPDNLFLVKDERVPGHELVKVLDFGIAKLARGPNGAGSFKTRTGVVMGTPVYMSPEQCLGNKEVDHRADIYALGVMLFHMLSGQPPFMSEGHGELLHMQISAAPPRLRALSPHIPERIEAIVARTLAKDPAHRPQSMAELEQALAPQPTAPWSAPRAVVAVGAPAAPAPAPAAAPMPTEMSASVIDRQLSKLRGGGWGRRVLIGGVAIGAVVVAVLALRQPPSSGTSAAAPPPAAPAAPAPRAPVIAPMAPAPPASPPPAPSPPLPPAPAKVSVEPAKKPARDRGTRPAKPSAKPSAKKKPAFAEPLAL